MKKTNHITRKIWSVVLAVAMFVSVVPFGANAADVIKAAFAPTKTLSFAALSDIHYYPKELTGDYCDAFMDAMEMSIGRESYESVGILDSALAALEEHAKSNGMEYVIVSGDLTADGEYIGHVKLAERLEKFEEQTGLKVLAINGNHDINRPDVAKTYENGYKEKARPITPEEFREVYAELGYDLAYHNYTPSTGKGNMLSYSVSDDGYRFIMIDSSKYSADLTDDGSDIGETSGAVSEEFTQWLLDEIADAKANGEVPLGVIHHNLVPHFHNEYKIMKGFNIDGWQELAEKLADAGMQFSFTGHIHMNDIAQTVTDNGETLTEVCVSSLTSFPNYFREFEITTDNTGKTELEVDSFDVDCVLPVTVNGETFEQPFRVESIKRTYFDERGCKGFASDFLGGYVRQLAPVVQEKGILEALKAVFGLDVEELLGGLIGEGITLGPIGILTMKNIMSFLADIDAQLSKHYFTDEEATVEYLLNSIDKLLSIQVSELPNDSFYDEYGLGSKTEPGTLDDLVMNTILYVYHGALDPSTDVFMNDAINNVEYGDVADQMFYALFDILANDLLIDQLLADLEINVDELFPLGSFGFLLGKILNGVLKVIFLGDTSILNIADTVAPILSAFGVIEGGSLMGIVEHLMDEYITASLLEGIGHSLANIVRDFAFDYNFADDMAATIVYDGKVEVEATRENYRLPTSVTVTLGEDSTSRNISWYTKSTVMGSDIEILEYSETPLFSGANAVPEGITVTADAERTIRSYPGIDFGIIGIMQYEIPMNRHTITVSGLEAGKKYVYRIGDASRNWWSEAGLFTMEDGSDETTFVHLADTQSMSKIQYERVASVLAKAQELYPEAGYMLSTGDNVDQGDNFNQWTWLLDEASDTFMNVPFMSASGNHEDMGDYAIVTNFTISNAPDQDTITGVYYSFDYNNTHTAVLNTNDLNEDDAISEEQIDWLINDMQSSDADWKFVALHKAPYSNGSHYDDSDVIQIRETLSVLMPELDIDMVFQGHDHVYLRTDSMIDNKVESVTTSTTTFNGKEYTVKENPQGSVYVISGCSGVKIYKQKDAALTDELFPRAEAIYDAEYSVFSGVRIIGDTLYFDAYEINPADGETKNIDSFAIQKDLNPDDTTDDGDDGFFGGIENVFENFVAKITAFFAKILSFLGINDTLGGC
ncbi:MAG: metallophosphoesterase [Clostridia bacterium]|nr:metallophosphoesterase [Clostridia bacterium]